jgi:hypothetical protein
MAGDSSERKNLTVLVFLAVLVLALQGNASPAVIVALAVGVFAITGKGGADAPSRLSQSGFGKDLSSVAATAGSEPFQPQAPPQGRRVVASDYKGAVEAAGQTSEDVCDLPPWGGMLADDSDLQADELNVRQVRARDQHAARQQTGIHMRRKVLVENAVEDELRREEASVWWERADA